MYCVIEDKDYLTVPEYPDDSAADAIQLVVAVGMDGRAVALDVIEGGDTFREEATTMDIQVVLWPSKFPRAPGLYLFTGRSTAQALIDGEYCPELVHHCTYTRLGNYSP